MFEEFDDILSVECITEILGIGRNTALKLLQSGEIPAKKVGRKWRILKEDVENYVRDSSNRK